MKPPAGLERATRVRITMCLRLGTTALLATLLAGSGAPGASAQPTAATPVPSSGTVVLLHGLGRTSRSMEPLADHLTAAGYRVVNLDYPSREKTIDSLVEGLSEKLAECCLDRPEPLHFVTHSLGGILVRVYLRDHHPSHLGRVVMLSPPNQGSEVVDVLSGTPLLEQIMGPSFEVLGTGDDSLPRNLGPVDFELGVITGDISFDPLFSSWIPGEDDGKVSVESARVEGMADFLVVPHSHPFIMSSDEVAGQVLHFLAHGRFDHPRSPAPEEP